MLVTVSRTTIYARTYENMCGIVSSRRVQSLHFVTRFREQGIRERVRELGTRTDGI